MKWVWKVYDVSGYAWGTTGYANGNRMPNNLEQKLAELEASEEEIFAVNVVSSTTAYVVTRRRA